MNAIRLRIPERFYVLKAYVRGIHLCSVRAFVDGKSWFYTFRSFFIFFKISFWLSRPNTKNNEIKRLPKALQMVGEPTTSDSLFIPG